MPSMYIYIYIYKFVYIDTSMYIYIYIYVCPSVNPLEVEHRLEFPWNVGCGMTYLGNSARSPGQKVDHF